MKIQGSSLSISDDTGVVFRSLFFERHPEMLGSYGHISQFFKHETASFVQWV